MEAKAELRRAIKERLVKFRENDRRVESQIIVRELKKILGDIPKIIGAYLPYADEPDIRPLLEELIKKNWTVAIPATGRSGMTFRAVATLQEVVKDPLTNIPTPPSDGETIIPNVVIVPGRAFTTMGMRLGRGSGGYDRWLAEHVLIGTSLHSIGVCFDCQIVQNIPTQFHDQPVDTVLTATKRFDRPKDA